MVGLGTQDDLALARDFVSQYQLQNRMLWDPSFESWRAFRVTTQPVFILLSRAGEEIGRWTWTSGGTLGDWENEIVSKARAA